MPSKLDQQVAGPTDLVEPRTDVTRLYTPITKWQTRILRLHAGTEGTPLQADLLIAGLIHDEGIVLDWTNESVSYEAISYSWGSDKATELIIVNGLDCNINPSLASALRRFRYHTTTRYLWADQLCVHQTDDAEKSAQVRNMFTIYRKAERVLVWLGEEDEGTAKALALYMRSEAIHTKEEKEKGYVTPVALKNAEMQNALATICLAPWPRRVWVQQEVFAAHRLTVHHGRIGFTLEQYKNMLWSLRATPIGSRQAELDRHWSSLKDLTMSDEHMIVLNMAKVVSTTWVTSKKSPFAVEEADTFSHHESDSAYISTLLETILSRSRNLEASDTRDYIYALLNLTHHPIATNKLTRNAIDIDYSRSVERVYEDVTRSILNRDQSLRILKYSSRHRASRVGLELPSWVVDWPSLHREATFWIPDGELSKMARQEHNEQGTIELCGFRLGRVASIVRQSKTLNGYGRIVTSLGLFSHVSFPGSLPDFSFLSVLAANDIQNQMRIFEPQGNAPRDQNEVAATEALTNIINRTLWSEEVILIDDEQLDVLGLPLTNKRPLDPERSEDISLVLDGAEVGDLIVQVDGWLHPVVLRENAMEDTFDFVCLAEFSPADPGPPPRVRIPVIRVKRGKNVSKMRRAFQKHMKATQRHAMERFDLTAKDLKTMHVPGVVSLVLLASAPLASAQRWTWAKYRVDMDNFADYRCQHALSKKHERHYRLESSKGCKTFSESINSFVLRFVQRQQDDKPEDWLCDFSFYEERECSGRSRTLNATSWLGGCVDMADEPDPFPMQSFKIECSGGNHWDDGSPHFPWEVEDS
ncbi:hypothetical protein LTR17_009115 [Elasticomyces elasticus]|nr:hypothetical protein LTR17_009115 [Elasticomyces elasticus]